MKDNDKEVKKGAPLKMSTTSSLHFVFTWSSKET